MVDLCHIIQNGLVEGEITRSFSELIFRLSKPTYERTSTSNLLRWSHCSTFLKYVWFCKCCQKVSSTFRLFSPLVPPLFLTRFPNTEFSQGVSRPRSKQEKVINAPCMSMENYRAPAAAQPSASAQPPGTTLSLVQRPAPGGSLHWSEAKIREIAGERGRDTADNTLTPVVSTGVLRLSQRVLGRGVLENPTVFRFRQIVSAGVLFIARQAPVVSVNYDRVLQRSLSGDPLWGIMNYWKPTYFIRRGPLLCVFVDGGCLCTVDTGRAFNRILLTDLTFHIILHSWGWILSSQPMTTLLFRLETLTILQYVTWDHLWE